MSFINDRILAGGYSNQSNCRLFDKADIWALILKQIRNLPVLDQVLWSLTCKTIARRLRSSHLKIPPSPIATSPTAVKKARLNFLLKIGPWFDDLSSNRNFDIIQMQQEYKVANSIPKSIERWPQRYVQVPSGWAFCCTCLKYRPTIVLMMHTANFSVENLPTPGRWTRVMAHARDENTKQLVLVEECGARNDPIGEFEQGWTTVPVSPRNFPGWVSPNTTAKKRKADGAATASASKNPVAAGTSSSHPGKRKTKLSAQPKMMAGNTATAQHQQEDSWAFEHKDPVLLRTGLETLTFLPVDAYGERASLMSVCPNHSFDPVKLMVAAT